MAAFDHYLPKKRAKLKNYVKNSQYSASFISFQKYFTLFLTNKPVCVHLCSIVDSKVALVDSSLTLLNPHCVGCRLNFAGWIKRNESTKKRKVSRFKLAAHESS